MTKRPPTVGILSQPKHCNVLTIKTLQLIPSPESTMIDRSDPQADLDQLRCASCEKKTEFSAGYTFLDEFLCDLCMERLVAVTGGAHAE
jgi:hypothetical protein